MVKRALVLEDCRTQGAIVCKMFRKAGFEAVWAETPRAAQSALKTGRFEILKQICKGVDAYWLAHPSIETAF